MTIRWTLALGVALGVAFAGGARAADKVTLQLKWVAQAQFAGYYVAKAKNYYKDADLDVTINPGGPASKWCGATFVVKGSVDLAASDIK